MPQGIASAPPSSISGPPAPHLLHPTQHSPGGRLGSFHQETLSIPHSSPVGETIGSVTKRYAEQIERIRATNSGKDVSLCLASTNEWLWVALMCAVIAMDSHPKSRETRPVSEQVKLFSRAMP